MAHRLPFPLGALLALCLCACGSAEARDAPLARKLHVVQGLGFPESVRYDAEQDVYFVSNMVGPGSVKDGKGYIARIPAATLGPVTIFAQGGTGGVVLDAPKGMAIQGDTLWVADIDVLRGFHRRTGAPLATLDLRPHRAMLLNDIAVGPDGTMRVTDTGISMTPKGVLYHGTDKIFAIGPGRAVSLLASGKELKLPNGITWDSAGRRWVVVAFHPFRSEVYTLGQGTRTTIAIGTGRFDGVEALSDGRLLVTSWSDSSLHVFSGKTEQRVIRGIWQPADLGVDTRRQRVAIPLVLQGRVEIWEIPGA
ncbi:MAG TPA: SMP-30/gluconolactonase/LRE family protein [Longimicrobium sp.]|jgi:sugar lactone lactonase YvrE